MTLILTLLALSGGFAAGWGIRGRTTIDYKQRWEDSLTLMDKLRETGEIEKKVVVEKQIVKELPRSESDEMIRQQLRKLAGWERADMEADRLHAGLAPVDDLSGLAGWEYQEMVQERYRYGYDELGQKFKADK